VREATRKRVSVYRGAFSILARNPELIGLHKSRRNRMHSDSNGMGVSEGERELNYHYGASGLGLANITKKKRGAIAKLGRLSTLRRGKR